MLVLSYSNGHLYILFYSCFSCCLKCLSHGTAWLSELSTIKFAEKAGRVYQHTIAQVCIYVLQTLNSMLTTSVVHVVVANLQSLHLDRTLT